MAILFRILFTLGLLILHVSVLSAQVKVSRDGPETPLKFISDNPAYVLASLLKNTPTYLNCHVSRNIDKSLQTDLGGAVTFYQEPSEGDDNDDDADETHDKVSDEEVRRQYQLQFDSSQTQKNKSTSNPLPARPSNDAKSRAARSVRDQLSFEWLRDGEKLISSTNDNQVITLEGFTLFPNGTLKLQPTNLTSGEYRCKAKYVSAKFVIGPIISTATVVEAPNLINDVNEKKNLTIIESEAAVINCPITSIPGGNFSWNFNNNELSFDGSSRQKDIRHFLLSNGSLLIVNSQTSDSGKYRCNATNQFAKKILRIWNGMLNVLPRPDNNYNHQSGLLSKLQSSAQKIKSGQNLVLHCASHANKISWTFTPRSSHIPISLTDFNNELKYVNVSETKHDGIYNCSSESDFQIFDVAVLTPPVFSQPPISMVTSVSASIKFNCSVSGNPMPTVEWYKNGEKIPNNHVKYFEYPIAKIESIDPEDEGIYQCLARNDYGEVSSTFYLHIRPVAILNHAPEKAKCYPTDNNTIHVRFSKENKGNRIQYFIASDSPREFSSQLSTSQNIDNFDIDTSKVNIFHPFKPFYLYMRNMLPHGTGKMIISQLSKPIICATQGVEPKFVKPQSGIFLRWDAPKSEANVTGYTIQFLNNKTSNPVVFTNEVIGTYEQWPVYVSWSEVEKNLSKISVKNSNKTDWTEVQVPGNVTGLYIINTEEVNVRILGSVAENGEILEQDLQYLSWTNIKASSFILEPIELGDVGSRDAEIHWSGLDNVQCAYMCYISKQDFISRDKEDKSRCDKIPSLSAKSFYLRKLKPTTDYDVFIKGCTENVLSTQINFQTKRDVPGPAAQSQIVIDNGIVLQWKKPRNPNGDIFFYQLEWTLRNVTHRQNVTELSFKFPNTTNTDRFNVTVMAFGVAGFGHPLIINPDKWGILPANVGSAEQQNATLYIDSFLIFVIIFISLILVVLVVGYVLCRRHRYCKNSNGIINSEQSSFPPTTSPLTENIRSDEMYEMQTLIPATQLMSNGAANGDVSLRDGNPSNGGIILTESQKVLRTSTPTDESVDQMCIELPPIKCDDDVTIQIDKPKAATSFLGSFHPKPVNDSKDLKCGSLKVIGNSSPFKCFQSDQNSSSGSSCDSHRQLIDTNLSIGLNNNDRSKIGKSSSIETDNEEEDSEENLHEYDLNDSNLSSKPLHPMSWNFRRPLVGPNG